MFKLKLHWQIFIAMGIGAFIGLIYQNLYHGVPNFGKSVL